MNKKITLILLGLFAAAWNATPAQAITGSSLELGNESFDVSVSTSNSGLNNADPDNLINTTANPNGFNNAFDGAGGNTFLLLGATDDNDTIDNGTNAAIGLERNVVDALSSFPISAQNINDDKLLNVQFDWAFQGNSSTDVFSVILEEDGGAFASREILFRDEYGSGSTNQNIDLTGLDPGDYNLIVSLSEIRNNGNSAAGFDNIVVSVPFGAAPNTGLLILGGMYAASSYRKRRKMSK